MPLNSKDRYAVIIAGGSGERFWPKSRQDKPKHLLQIVGDSPMICQTVNRLAGFLPRENIFIITHYKQKKAIEALCPEIAPENIVAEPVKKNTAAAVGLGLCLVKRKNPEAGFVILPADHVVRGTEGFQKSLNAAFEYAEEGDRMLTLGIQPSFPSTAYGYLHRGKLYSGHSDMGVYKLQSFVEKPSKAIAEQYICSGEYFWNAGIFVWKVETLEAALKKNTNWLYEACKTLSKEEGFSDKALKVFYESVQAISIDYALMEKADNVFCIQALFEWDDVGEWDAIERHYPKDSLGNIVQGKGVVVQGSGNLVVSGPEHLTVVLGLNNIQVLQSEGVTLVCPKNSSANIRTMLAYLKEQKEYQDYI